MNSLQIFCGKYAGRVGFVFSCMFCITVKFCIDTSKYENPDGVFMLLPIMFVLMAIPDIFCRKFAYKINFDFDKSEVIFFMFFPLIKQRTITVKIDDIEKITINVFVIFVFNGEKVRYNGVNNNELIQFLESIKAINWTRSGRFINKNHDWL